MTEVLRVLLRRGTSFRDARRIFSRLQVSVATFDDEHAAAAAEVGALGPHLSLGDCACLALARLRAAERVLTADRAWTSRDYGVPVVLVR